MIGNRNKNSCREKYSLYPRPVSVFTQKKVKVFIHTPPTLICQLLSLFILWAVSRAMSTPQEKAARVWCLADWKSVTVVQKRFRTGHGRETLSLKCIWFRDKDLRTTWDSFMWKISGKSTDIWIRLWSYNRKAFRRIPHTSICAASNQLPIPRPAVHQLLHEALQHLTRLN